MSHIMRILFFGVPDQVQHKLEWTTTDDGQRLEISDDCTIYATKKDLLAAQLPLFFCMQKSVFFLLMWLIMHFLSIVY